MICKTQKYKINYNMPVYFYKFYAQQCCKTSIDNKFMANQKEAKLYAVRDAGRLLREH